MKAEALSKAGEDAPFPSQIREILDLAVPATLAIASEPLLSLADTAMIGHLGVEPLAARAIASSLIGGIYWLFIFLIFGTTTLVGYHHGANEPEACGETCLHALLLALTGGVATAALAIFFAPHLYLLMGAEKEVMAEGVRYFRVRVAGTPFTFFFYVTVGFLRGIQNTRTPMLIAFFVNGTNLLLDYVLIYGKLGLPALGLYGAALAALFSQALGGALCLRLLFFSSYTVPYGLTRWRLSPRGFLPLFRIGSDLAIRTGALRFSLVFATATAARMGTAILSSHEIALQLWLLCSDVIDGIAVAGQLLVAKHVGGGRADRAYRLGKALLLCGFLAGLAFALGYLASQPLLIGFFTSSPEPFIILGGWVFLLLALFQPLNGMVFVLDGFLIGARDTRFLMWAMLFGALGLFVPVSWISLRWGWGLLGVWGGLTLLMAWRLGSNLFRFLSLRPEVAAAPKT